MYSHLFLLVGLITVALSSPTQILKGQRSFTIDWKNNVFLKDGEPFRYVAGCVHYFRSPNEYWYDRLIKMRAAGVNALQTYIEWASHEPREGEYNFKGDLNITQYFETAMKADLLIVLRIGPYICAERDMGGLPWWLLKYNVQLRRNNDIYMAYVTKWFKKLLPKIKPYLYKNGGPIITIQIENEYGAYGACDFNYTSKLRDIVRSSLGKDVVLFTTDQPNHDGLRCALINKTLGTVDFGVGVEPSSAFGTLRAHQASGPLVNSEFYPGWLDRWGEPHQTRRANDVAYWLNKILAYNASVSFYMFHGGTSFGLNAGANYESGRYLPQTTSYDYDAPLTEAGDLTDKYHAIKKVISQYLPIPNITLSQPCSKLNLESVNLTVETTYPHLFSGSPWKTHSSNTPQAFEYLGARNGLVLYSTKITFKPSSPSLLSIVGLRDRAYVYVNNVFQGYMGRQEGATVLPIRADKMSVLDILVENQGRVNYGVEISEHSGIFGDVKLGSKILTNWNHTYLEDWDDFMKKGAHSKVGKRVNKRSKSSQTPALLKGQFVIPANTTLCDTFLWPSSLSKGFVYINGHSIGRYWPNNGPQVTLYVPGVWLKPNPEINRLVIVELEKSECLSSGRCLVEFSDKPKINAATPDNF